MAAKKKDNLRLWKPFADTPKEFTKPITGRGFKGTSINATYTLRALTELFGPCGVAWRVVVEDERYVPGHLLKDGSTRAVVHVVRGHLDYVDPETNEWVSTGSQYGQTTYVGEDKNGSFTKEEAPKMSLTDLTTKLSCLVGINSSIFLGLWDDNKWAQPPADGSYVPTNAKAAAATTGTYAQPTGAVVAAAPAATPPAAPDTTPFDGGTDVSTFTLPTSSADWLPDQYGAYFESVTDPGILVAALRAVSKDPKLKEDIESYSLICEAVSDRARSIMDKRTNLWKETIAILTAEKAIIDSRKIT